LARENFVVIVSWRDLIAIRGAPRYHAAFMRCLERIAKGVSNDIASLQVDGTTEDAGKTVEAGVGFQQAGVGLELICRVTEPHSFDVARDDERQFLLFIFDNRPIF
jgi:hypothetical protein